MARDQVVQPGDNWIVWASAQIGYKNGLLCIYNPQFLGPIQSAASSWIAIEGPGGAPPPGGNNIVQVGYIECQFSDACNLSGIPSNRYNQVIYFRAFGSANDVFHLPSPQYIDVATSGYHFFKVNLHYLGGGARQWEISVDGVVRRIIGDDWRTWNRQTVQNANEVWNEGDQLGGTETSLQNLRAVTWYNGTTHTGLTGSPYRSGHCYPWSRFNVISSAWHSTWTTNTHTDC